MSEEEASKEQNSSTEAPKGSSHVTLVIMIVCIIAASLGLIFYMKDDGKGDKANGNDQTKQNEETVGNLVDGKDYRIYIRNLEVQPKKANGDSWDRSNGAPDVFYKVIWKSNEIHKSDKKENSLIAEWIPVGMSLKDSILSGKISVDQAIDIPIIRYDKGMKEADEIVFKVVDADLLEDDSIEEVRVYLSKLRLGDNIFDFRDKEGHGLVKAVIRVIDNSLSTDEKIQALMRGQ